MISSIFIVPKNLEKKVTSAIRFHFHGFMSFVPAINCCFFDGMFVLVVLVVGRTSVF